MQPRQSIVLGSRRRDGDVPKRDKVVLLIYTDVRAARVWVEWNEDNLPPQLVLSFFLPENFGGGIPLGPRDLSRV